jgi:hypothetical protein
VYLKYRNIVIASGNETYNLGEPPHDGDVGNGRVLEQFHVQLSLKQIEQIADAPLVKGKVGIHEFRLTAAQQRSIKEFVEQLKVDEATAARKVRERNAPILTDWRDAKKEAEEAARRGSKNLRQRAYDRVMTRKVAEICERHKITKEQLVEIVSEN